MKALSLAVLFAALWLGIDQKSSAAGKSITNAVPTKPAVAAKSKPFRGRLKTVDLNAKIIVLEGAKAQTYQITSETRISKDDKPATLNEISVGESVTGFAREIAEGKWEARSLYAGKRTSKTKN
jgi:hypothetical protein